MDRELKLSLAAPFKLLEFLKTDTIFMESVFNFDQLHPLVLHLSLAQLSILV